VVSGIVLTMMQNRMEVSGNKHHKVFFMSSNTTRKSINTNRNTEGIFLSVNFQEILPTDIFPRYIPRELRRDKKIKTKQKNDDVSGFSNGITDEIYSVGKSVGNLVYTVHHVNYKRNHRRTKSIGIF